MTTAKQAAGALARVLGAKPENLPTLPQTALQVSRLTEDQGTHLKHLAQVIQRDPPLAARILRMANAPAFRVRAGGEIRDIARAVNLMGFKQVGNLAIGLTVISALGAGQPLKNRMKMLQLWKHSVVVGLLCEILANGELGLGRGFYVYGLVHDIGKLALSSFRAVQYEEVLLLVEKGASPIEAENQVLMVDHCFVAQNLLIYWDLSPALVAAAGSHHAPWDAGEYEPVAGLVFLADLLAGVLGYKCFQQDGDALLELPAGPVGAYLKDKGWSLPEFIKSGLKDRLVKALASPGGDVG